MHVTPVFRRRRPGGDLADSAPKTLPELD